MIVGLVTAVVNLCFGLYLGYRRGLQDADTQHRHSLHDLDQFRTNVSVSNTRHGTYARINIIFSPNRDRGLATGICCSKTKLNLHEFLFIYVLYPSFPYLQLGYDQGEFFPVRHLHESVLRDFAEALQARELLHHQ